MEVPFKGFRSINNVDATFTKEFTDLERATNCDLDNKTRLRRRKGETLLFAGDTHSVFSNDAFALYRQGTSLYRLKDDFTGGVVIKTGLTAGARMACMGIPGGRVFMSDGFFKGWTDGHDVHVWGIDPPSPAPVMVATSGRMPQGKYQVALTYLRKDGEESGAVRTALFEGSGGIAFSSIPVSADPDVTEKCIYIARPGGKKRFRAMRIANATTSATYSGNALDTTIELKTQFMGPPPAGTILGWQHGRALVGYDCFLHHSEAWRPELFKPDSYTAFTSAVRMIAPLKGGVWVGTASEVAFLRGADIAAAEYELKARTAVMRGSVDYINGSRLLKGVPGIAAVFTTEQGVCAGTEDGELVDITGDYYKPATAARGAALTRNTAGNYDQYLVVLR